MAPKQRNAQAVTSYDVVELKPEALEGQELANPSLLGLVWRTADDSDNSDIDEDFSDDEDFYDDEGVDMHRRLEENHAEVVWIADEASKKMGSDIKRTENDMSQLKVVDRCMQQGDIVASATDPLGQTGVVLDVARDVNVILSTGQLLERQSSEHLQPEIVYQPGQYVLHKDGWFGRIDLVFLKLTVAFESGAMVELIDMDDYDRPLLKPIVSDGSLPPTVSEASDFYPGQHVIGDPHLRGFPGTHVLKGSLHYVGSQSSLRGIMVKSEAHCLKITWLNSLAGGDLEKAPQGPSQPSDCTPITHLYFCPAYWHLGTIGLWRGDGANLQESSSAEPSPVKAAEGANRGQGSKSRTKGSLKHGAAGSASNRAVPRGDALEAADQPSCPSVQQLSLNDQPPSREMDAAAPQGENAAMAEDAAGGRTANQETPAARLAAGGAQPDEDPLQAMADRIVADCINDILEEVTPEEVAAQSPGQVQVPQPPQEQEPAEAVEEAAESGWSSMGRRGWDAAAAVMGAVGLGRASAPMQDSSGAHGARRSRILKKRGRGRRPGAAQPPLQLKDLPVTAQVLRTYTRATVQWQDGTISKDVDSPLLLPLKHTDEHDFYPNGFVAAKSESEDLEGLSDAEKLKRTQMRLGLVKSVEHNQRTAVVEWHDCTQRKTPGLTCITPEDLASLEQMQAELSGPLEAGPEEPPYEEVVSVYTIELQFQFDDMAVGNVVARMDFRAAAAEGRLRGSVGSILRLDGFCVFVHWLDGTQSSVGMKEVFVIGTEEDLANAVDGDSEDELDSDSEFDLHGDSDDYMTEEEGRDERDETSLGSKANAGFRDTVLHVHGNIRREAESMNDAWRAASVSDIDGSSPRTVGEGAVYEEEDAAALSDAPVSSGGASPDAATLAQPPSAPLQSAISAASPSEPAGDYCFPHFEVTEEDPTGFEEMPIDPGSMRPSRGFQKAVLAEWKMLRDGLPPSIWVRAYESRMDVMRAAILGAAGTPYHDQLFFFDIQLSPDHPANVPKVLFHSHGNRINPNLYLDGKVCLSLLNTWNGRRTEQWDPSSSTILQVLVSIQGLILVPEPYYNEAGYQKQVGTLEGARNSVVYNESAFLATIRTTLSLIRSPPAPFLPLMLAVIGDRGPRLLRACQAYMAGTARVGTYSDASQTEGQQQQEQQKEGDGAQQTGLTTQGFQLVFKGVLPRLEQAVRAMC